MKNILIIILTITLFSCKKEKQEICEGRTYYYYYYKYNGSQPTSYLGGEYINNCDDKKMQEFISNKPLGYSIGYHP